MTPGRSSSVSTPLGLVDVDGPVGNPREDVQQATANAGLEVRRLFWHRDSHLQVTNIRTVLEAGDCSGTGC